MSKWWAAPILAAAVAFMVAGALLAHNLYTQSSQTQAETAPAEDYVIIPAPADPGIPAPEGATGGLQLNQHWLRETSARAEVPQRALQAYVAASLWAQQTAPKCGLSWNTLAGIGKIETDHGRYQGARVEASGQVVPHLFGVQLNGRTTAQVADTDQGRMDSDPHFDRAVGPMQFLPGTWNAFAVDGNGDGQKDPHNIDDAAAAAANYLCTGGRTMTEVEGYGAALMAYNPSEKYVFDVAAEAQRIAEVLAADPRASAQPAADGHAADPHPTDQPTAN